MISRGQTARHLTGSMVALALATLVALCLPDSRASLSGEPAAAPPAQAGGSVSRPTTLGTIEARLNGDARTWYVVAGDTRDPRRSAGSWYEPRPGERLIAIAGFDTATPPLQSFTRDASGRWTSYGDYDGSLFTMIFNVGSDPQPRRETFPPKGQHTVVYVAQAGKLNLSKPGVDIKSMLAAMHDLQTGTLNVTAIGFDGDRAFIEGTFSGTLEAPGGNRMTVTDGKFQARSLPKLDVTRP